MFFSHYSQVIHDSVPIEKIAPMTEAQYQTDGSTALLDAIGGAIHHIGNVHKYARDEDRPEKTIIVITTDGEENSSNKYTYSKIKKMIECQTEKYGWEFVFLGANIDAIGEASKIGIRADRAVRYECDGLGTAINFESMSLAVSDVRMGKAMSANWKVDIEKHYKAKNK